MLRNGNLNLIPASRLGGAGFSPSDLNPLLWLDAGVGVTETAGATSAWANQGSGATDATQGTALNQPTYNASGFGANSKPYLDFDGTNSYLTLGSVDYSKLTQHSVFSVFEADSVSGGRTIISDNNNANSAPTYGLSQAIPGDSTIENTYGDEGLATFRVVRSTETVTTATEYILNHTYASGDTLTSIRLNGVGLTESSIAGTGTTIAGTKYNMSIGRRGDFNNFYFDGKIAEILIFNSVLSTDDIASMETYLSSKYGI